MSKLAWSVASITDRGLIRRDNQDNYFVSEDKRLFVVADGMGGVKGGAEASRLAVEAVRQAWIDNPPQFDDHDKIELWLRDAVGKANDSVCDAADLINSESRMGTTIVVALQADGNKVHIAHVGDSRAYLLKDGALEALTNDHSMVYEMMQHGQLTWQQCKDSVWRSVLTRCIGHERGVAVDQSVVDLLSGEWVVLCSDGLCGFVTDEKIAETIADCSTAEEACSKLMLCSMEVGAPDNVTVVAINYWSDDSADVAKHETMAKTPNSYAQSPSNPL